MVFPPGLKTSTANGGPAAVGTLIAPVRVPSEMASVLPPVPSWVSRTDAEQPAASPAIVSVQFAVSVPVACVLGVVSVKVAAKPKFQGFADCPLSPNSAVGAR